MSLIIMSKKVREFELYTPTVQFSGHFKLEVINPSTGKVKRSLEFDNLILNSGLNRFNSPSSATTFVADRVCVGTGTSAPVVTQTSLDSFSASAVRSATTHQSASQTIVNDLYSSNSSRIRFVAGTLNGNYSEVGVGWSNTQLFSRALIVDQFGNPTSITVLSDEALDVTYTLRMYIPQNDVTTSVTISGVGTDIPLTIRASLIRQGAGIGGSNQDNVPWDGTCRCGWSMTNSASGASASMWGASGTSPYQTDAGSIGITPNFNIAPTTSTSLNSATSVTYTRAGALNSTLDITLTVANYVTDSFYKDSTVIFGLNAHNATYQHFVVGFRSMGAYQYLLGTPITKTSSQVLTLNFRCSWARRTI